MTAVSSVTAPRTSGASHAAPMASRRPLPTLAPPGDLVSLLAAAQLDMRDASASQAKSSAQSASMRRDESLEKAREAEKAAAEAQRAAEKAHGWLSKLKVVGLVAGAVASVAAACCTCGSAAPAAVALVGLALSASSEKIGEKFGSTWGEAAALTGLGLSVVGAGWGAFATGAAEAATTRGAIEIGARLTESAADGGAAYEQKVESDRQADASDAHADALERRTLAKDAQRDVELMIDLLRTAEKAARKGMQAVMAMSKDVETTHTMMSASIGKAVRA